MRIIAPTLSLLLASLVWAPTSVHAWAVGDKMAELKGLVCTAAIQGLKLSEVRNRIAIWQERWLYPFSVIEPHLIAQVTPIEIALKMIESDDRAMLFRFLEPAKHFYERLFKNSKDWKQIKNFIEIVNRAEDSLGKAVDARKFAEKVRKLLSNDPAAAPAIQKAEEDARTALLEFAELLKDDGWISQISEIDGPTGKAPRLMKEAVDLILNFEVPTQAEEAEWIEKAYPRFVREAMDDYGFDYENPDPEEDVHKEKRRNRSALVEKAHAASKIKTVKYMEMPAGLAPYQEVSEIGRKYNETRTSPFEVKHRVFFNVWAENAVSHFIERFDRIKVDYELWENTIKVIRKSGFIRNRAKAEAYLLPKMKAAFPEWRPWNEPTIRKGKPSTRARDAMLDYKEARPLDYLVIPRSSLPKSKIEEFESPKYRLPEGTQPIAP